MALMTTRRHFLKSAANGACTRSARRYEKTAAYGPCERDLHELQRIADAVHCPNPMPARFCVRRRCAACFDPLRGVDHGKQRPRHLPHKGPSPGGVHQGAHTPDTKGNQPGVCTATHRRHDPSRAHAAASRAGRAPAAAPTPHPLPSVLHLNRPRAQAANGVEWAAVGRRQRWARPTLLQSRL